MPTPQSRALGLMLGLTILLGCASDSDSDPPPDPPGTITTLLYNQVGSGGPPCGIDFETGAVDSPVTGTGWHNADIDVGLGGNNIADAPFTTADATIASVGAVSGLGEITIVPSAGFVVTVAAIEGDGYVVNTGSGTYYRVYLADQLFDYDGGFALKWTVLTP